MALFSSANLTSTPSVAADQSTMTNSLSSLFFLGAYAVQAVFGRPDASRVLRGEDIVKRSVDSLYVM